MSEYQYYEFRTVEHPLTRDQMDDLRALSSRATITPTSFQNTYNYEQAGRHHEFEEALAGFQAKHGCRNALRRRLEKAGLVSEGSSAIRWQRRPSLDRVE